MIKQGDSLPNITLKQMTADGPTGVSIADYTVGRKVVIFALPGAFTPTCSEHHLPGFVGQADAIKAKGVAAIACVSSADFFVMEAWGKSQNVGSAVDMLSDGNLEFTEATGMTLDLSGAGLGTRSSRYAMIVDDGTVSWIGIEENAGEAVSSSADAVLAAL